ncbi:MAG TPA: DUF1850 domain-containing protein [Methylomirabilota bacterium]|nr:DUF1850 domain-containing protein [Methylomirabilota bacterium]
MRDGRRRRGGRICAAWLALLAAGCASAPPAERGLALTVTDMTRGRVLAREPVEAGALVDLAYVHSTEGRPVRATFRVEADGMLRLVQTAFPSVGPGLPALGPDGSWTIQDGVIRVQGSGDPMSELRLRVVPLTRHQLILPSGRALDLGALVGAGDAVRVAVE